MVTQEMAIARLRKLQGERSLRQFAHELRISYQYLAEIYSGRRSLAGAVPVLDFLGLARNPPEEPTYIRVRKKK